MLMIWEMYWIEDGEHDECFGPMRASFGCGCDDRRCGRWQGDDDDSDGLIVAL